MLDDLMPQDQIAHHVGSPQVQVAVPQPQRLVDVCLLGHAERGSAGGVEDGDRVRGHLDVTCRQVGIARSRRAQADGTHNLYDVLCVQLRGHSVSRLGRLRVHHHLSDPIPVANIYEYQSAVVPLPVDPPLEHCRGARVFGSEFPAGSCSLHFLPYSLWISRPAFGPSLVSTCNSTVSLASRRRQFEPGPRVPGGELPSRDSNSRQSPRLRRSPEGRNPEAPGKRTKCRTKFARGSMTCAKPALAQVAETHRGRQIRV